MQNTNRAQESGYKASLTREQFLFHEMRIVAKQMVQGEDLASMIQIIAANNLFQYPTERMTAGMVRACYRRLNLLNSEQLLRNIAEHSVEEAKQICLYAIMKDSPLPFEGWTNNRFIEENIKTGELNKQPVFQIGKPSFSKIRVAVANIQMDISNFDQAVMRKPNRSYRRYQQIAELVNTAVREKADMLVMPEACTPKEWLPTLARTCEKNHLAVVTGVEHIIEDNCVYNLTAVILPYEEKWTGQWHSVILYHSKNHFAPEEKRMIESLHLRAMEGIESSEAKCDAKYELYSWNGFWFTVYCCFELTSIRDRSIFQSYIDALIAVEWNQDVNYYSNIIESLSRDIHCYCIQTNTSEYGDSRITKPSKTENKDILRIKGGSNATAHVGTIDLEQLREFQMKAYSGQKEDKTFKPTPPDFDYKGAYERRKGTMFECFCAKKKAD